MTPAPPADALPDIEIFSGLSAPEMAELVSEFDTLAVPRGETLMRQGEPADALYIVLSGRFAVTVHGRRAPVSDIGPDQPIGEIAFLAGGARTATVSALRDSIVLRLGRAAFERLSAERPSIWRALTVTLARRLGATMAAEPVAPAPPRPRTLALIRAGGAPTPAAFFAALAAVFKSAARTLVVDADTAHALLGGSPAGAAATQALAALESGHDYVLFLADAEPTEWSERAIRHADTVIAAGMHGADPAPNALERRAAELLAPDQLRLVLLHTHRTRISGTARWLDRRTVAMHHHVALDAPEDTARLFRFINGQALGLVACGGGALCAAHVGVYRAFIEAGVGFDIMGGTSAGGAMAAAFALGTAPDAVAQAIHDIFISNRAMRRYTWPRYSLLDHRNFDAQLARYFGGIDIEDLWIPFFAVSTNLSSCALHRHCRGDLWSALRASASIPVLLPPVYTADGQMLVDGCLLDNVPVRTMHELKSGPNIVVSFVLPESERFDVDYPSLPSRSELLRRTFNPLRRGDLPEAPGLAAVLMRSLMANRHDFKRYLRAEDLLLVPPLPANAGFLDWTRHPELIELAYRWASDQVDGLKASGHPALGRRA